jgi:hypothetical protein
VSTIRFDINEDEMGERLWMIEDHLDPVGTSWTELSERERDHYRLLAQAFADFLLARLVTGDDVIPSHTA